LTAGLVIFYQWFMSWNISVSLEGIPHFLRRGVITVGGVALLSAFTLSPCSLQGAKGEPGSELGMWVWQHKDLEDSEGQERLLAFCRERGIGRIFVEITFGGEPGNRKLKGQERLRDLLRKAAEAGIIVEALDGHQEMSLEKCREDTLQRLDLVLAFQAELPVSARFAGLHYDMEPYLGERWKSGDEQGVMRETLETMAAIREKVTPDTGLTLAYDIPSWYDRHPDTLSIVFAGAKKNFHQHIQDLSDYIGIMSYRREAGMILDICAAEFAYGNAIGKKVYPAMETGRLKDEPEITFYGAAPEVFLGVLKEVQEAKEATPSFGGVFLHYYESLRELFDQKGD
jgi:hypothetical protein